MEGRGGPGFRFGGALRPGETTRPAAPISIQNSVSKSSVPVSDPVRVSDGLPKEAAFSGTRPDSHESPAPEHPASSFLSSPGQGMRSKTSLKAFGAKVQENLQNGQAAAKMEETPFDQSALMAVWNAYVKNLEQEHPSLYSVLSNANPELNENYAVSLKVPNRFAGGDLLSGNNEKNLLDYLRSELKNSAIHFIIHVDESMEPSKAIYTPLEKFQDMQRNNPEIKNFRDSLNLDLEL